MGSSIPSFALSQFWFQEANISPTPLRSIPALPGCRAEGLRPHTLGGLGSCLFRRRPAATPNRRRQLSDARGHLPPWPPTRRSRTIRVTLSSDPKCCRATASAFSAARRAAWRPACTSSSAPTRPMNFASVPPWAASRSEKADCRSAPLPRRCQTAQAAPATRCQVLSTAARRWQAESLRGLPFACVRGAIYVQYFTSGEGGVY